jgi:hypothetical protein
MLKKAVGKAAGESKPEAYPQGYVEDVDEPRTPAAAFFSILLERQLGVARFELLTKFYQLLLQRGKPVADGIGEVG